MCNYRRFLDGLKKLTVDDLFEDYDVINQVFRYTKFDWFQEQSVIWHDKFRPEMVPFLGRSGFGFNFNMLNADQMFRNR
jgi:hypothetical protein